MQAPAIARSALGSTARPQQHARRGGRGQALRPACSGARQQADQQPAPAAGSVDRRQLLSGVAAALAAGAVLQAPAAATAAENVAVAGGELATYADPSEAFQIGVPAGWTFGEGGLEGNSSFSGASGVRRVLGWSKDGEPGTNVVIVLTTVGFDYTGMGSFGSAYDFGSNLVGSMDRSYLLRTKFGARPDGDIQLANLVDAREVSLNGPKSYYVEYTVQRPNGDARHLYSVATLGHNGRYNRLYTVTAQCAEDAVTGTGALLEKVVKSFRPPPLATFGRQ